MSALASVREEKQQICFKQILMATDFSAASQRALARSARLASHIPWAVTHDVLCESKCPFLTVIDYILVSTNVIKEADEAMSASFDLMTQPASR
jgi:nucleotide-binding universal stress UspA family protein